MSAHPTSAALHYEVGMNVKGSIGSNFDTEKLLWQINVFSYMMAINSIEERSLKDGILEECFPIKKIAFLFV